MPPLPIDDGRDERVRILDALDRALADPRRLIGILVEAVDDDDAIARLVDAYGVDPVGAEALLDLQVRRVIPAHRARIAEELQTLRAQHSFRAGGSGAEYGDEPAQTAR